jgi:hypothetical protein
MLTCSPGRGPDRPRGSPDAERLGDTSSLNCTMLIDFICFVAGVNPSGCADTIVGWIDWTGAVTVGAYHPQFGLLREQVRGDYGSYTTYRTSITFLRRGTAAPWGHAAAAPAGWPAATAWSRRARPRLPAPHGQQRRVRKISCSKPPTQDVQQARHHLAQRTRASAAWQLQCHPCGLIGLSGKEGPDGQGWKAPTDMSQDRNTPV